MDMNTIALIKGLAGNGGGGSSLPTNPAQDGTYALQNTVSSGTSTLSWASGGSSGGVLVVEFDNDGNLDITAGELFSAAQAGYVVVKGASENLGNVVLPLVAATNKEGYDFAIGFFDGYEFTTWFYHAALSTQKPSFHEP